MNINNQTKPYEILGELKNDNILIIADHASNIIPEDIDLGINEDLLNNHIAVDIGVKPVCEILVERLNFTAIMATQSRLIIDLNRNENDLSLIPKISDEHIITGNDIDEAERLERIICFHRPYHDYISDVIARHRPALIMALHSYSPILRSAPDEIRPWEAGVMYGPSDKAAKLSIEYLKSYGLVVGDQLPYTGEIWNASMDRHAEPHNIPYFGVEMRQDLVNDQQGCERFAQILGDICVKITKTLAS